jgi:hypothetical protein
VQLIPPWGTRQFVVVMCALKTFSHVLVFLSCSTGGMLVARRQPYWALVVATQTRSHKPCRSVSAQVYCRDSLIRAPLSAPRALTTSEFWRCAVLRLHFRPEDLLCGFAKERPILLLFVDHLRGDRLEGVRDFTTFLGSGAALRSRSNLTERTAVVNARLYSTNWRRAPSVHSHNPSPPFRRPGPRLLLPCSSSVHTSSATI